MKLYLSSNGKAKKQEALAALQKSLNALQQASEALSESNKLTGIGTELLKQKIDELMNDIAKKKSKIFQIE